VAQQTTGQQRFLPAPGRRDIGAILFAGSALALLHSPAPLPIGVLNNVLAVLAVQTPRLNQSTANGMPATLRANVPGPLPAGAAWTLSAPQRKSTVADTSRGSALYLLGTPVVNQPNLALARVLWQPIDTSQSAYAARQALPPTPFHNPLSATLSRTRWQPLDTSRYAYPVVSTTAFSAPSAYRRYQSQFHANIARPTGLSRQQAQILVNHLDKQQIEDEDDDLLLM
jgi:hypothetical protein